MALPSQHVALVDIVPYDARGVGVVCAILFDMAVWRGADVGVTLDGARRVMVVFGRRRNAAAAATWAQSRIPYLHKTAYGGGGDGARNRGALIFGITSVRGRRSVFQFSAYRLV